MELLVKVPVCEVGRLHRIRGVLYKADTGVLIRDIYSSMMDQEMARAIYASKDYFEYYCRITCTKGYSGKREDGNMLP